MSKLLMDVIPLAEQRAHNTITRISQGRCAQPVRQQVRLDTPRVLSQCAQLREARRACSGGFVGVFTPLWRNRSLAALPILQLLRLDGRWRVRRPEHLSSMDL